MIKAIKHINTISGLINNNRSLLSQLNNSRIKSFYSSSNSNNNNSGNNNNIINNNSNDKSNKNTIKKPFRLKEKQNTSKITTTTEPTTEPKTEPTTEPTIEPKIEPKIEPTTEPTIDSTIESQNTNSNSNNKNKNINDINNEENETIQINQEEINDDEIKKKPKIQEFGKKVKKKLNDSTKWVEWLCGMIDTLGSISVNKNGDVELNITQKYGDFQSFSTMKRKLGGGVITHHNNTINYNLLYVNPTIIKVLNVSNLRNPVKQKQFSQVCEHYKIQFKDEKKRINSTDGWVFGLYESICSAHIDMDKLSLQLTFTHDNQDIIKSLATPLGGNVSFDSSIGQYKLVTIKRTVVQIEEFLKYFKRKSIKLAKSYNVTISPPLENKKKKKENGNDNNNNNNNNDNNNNDNNNNNKPIDYLRKLEIWSHFMKVYDQKTKEERVNLITINSKRYKNDLKYNSNKKKNNDNTNNKQFK